MNSRREHRMKVYNNMYKKYLSFMKKTGEQKTRNRLLQSTNSELSKEIIKLKEEIRKSLSTNSNLKTEIYDLTEDKKHLMDNSKGLYNTLTTLHKDTVAFEKRISHLLNSLDPEIQSFDVQKVNGIKNPKDTRLLPDTNYHRYNFKDFIYVQDLSPIMEENVEFNKKLIKPSDFTRRLGHRAKVPHTDKCSENLEVNGFVLDEDAEINSANSSPSYERMQDFCKDFKNVGKQLAIVEEETIPNVAGVNAAKQLSSLLDCNESNNMTGEESILSSSLPNISASRYIPSFKNENDSVSPLPTIDIIPPSSSENTINEKEDTSLNEKKENSLNEKDFNSALFANVFPRRRMINNSFSFSLGSIEEDGNEERISANIEKENSSPSVSINPLKNDLEHGSFIRIRSDSLLKSNLTISQNNIDLTPEMSHQDESIKENTCSDIQDGMGTITTERYAVDESNMDTKNLSEINEYPSSHEKLKSLSKLAEDKTMEEEISTSSFKISNDSHVGHSSMKKSSYAEGRASLLRPCSKKSSLDSICKSAVGKKSEVKPLARISDKNPGKSSKYEIQGRKSLEDAKKSLRPKKPLNFAESPVVKTNPKRKRKLEKANKFTDIGGQASKSRNIFQKPNHINKPNFRLFGHPQGYKHIDQPPRPE